MEKILPLCYRCNNTTDRNGYWITKITQTKVGFNVYLTSKVHYQGYRKKMECRLIYSNNGFCYANVIERKFCCPPKKYKNYFDNNGKKIEYIENGIRKINKLNQSYERSRWLYLQQEMLIQLEKNNN